MKDEEFIEYCATLKTISFDMVAGAVLEASAKYRMVPSDTHKQSVIASSKVLLLRELLDDHTSQEIIEKVNFLSLLNLTHN